MIHYIETRAKDGSEIRIEVEDISKSGVGFSRKSTQLDVGGETAQDAYKQTLNTIRACADGIVETIQSLETLPSGASVDFAIKIDGEAGAMVAKSREQGQFRVSLSWKQEPEETKKPDFEVR